jgi:hypothetical protein
LGHPDGQQATGARSEKTSICQAHPTVGIRVFPTLRDDDIQGQRYTAIYRVSVTFPARPATPKSYHSSA